MCVGMHTWEWSACLLWDTRGMEGPCVISSPECGPFSEVSFLLRAKVGARRAGL